MEEEENLEKIQCKVNVKIAVARIHNENICQEWEDKKQKEVEEPEDEGGKRLEEERGGG